MGASLRRDLHRGAAAVGLEKVDNMTRKSEIKSLESWLTGLGNDARYWDLRRTYGDYSIEVLRHLRACAAVQRRGENHT